MAKPKLCTCCKDEPAEHYIKEYKCWVCTDCLIVLYTRGMNKWQASESYLSHRLLDCFVHKADE